MNNIGRNDACHCGSGKKYKKCCLDKDEEQKSKALLESKIANERFNSFKQEDPDENDIDPLYEDELDDYFSDDMEDDLEDETENPFPHLTVEEQAILSEWWDKFDDISDDATDEIRKHLEDFLNTHPQLVEFLGLEDDVLFELGANYQREGRIEEYIKLLLELRTKFPATYNRSSQYYSSDIIAWLISQNRTHEINTYLDDFKQDATEREEQINNLLNLFRALNLDQQAKVFAASIRECYISEDYSEYIPSAVPMILLMDEQSKYLRPENIEQNVAAFIEHVKNIYSEFEDLKKSDYWEKRFKSVLSPYQSWTSVEKYKPNNIDQLYFKVSFNYIRFLNEFYGLSWITSEYYSFLIFHYLMEYKKSKGFNIRKPFDLSYYKLESIIGSLSKDFIYINPTTMIGLLNTAHYFADYLHHCSEIDEKEMKHIQKYATTLFDKTNAHLVREYTNALCFKNFPLYKRQES